MTPVPSEQTRKEAEEMHEAAIGELLDAISDAYTEDEEHVSVAAEDAALRARTSFRRLASSLASLEAAREKLREVARTATGYISALDDAASARLGGWEGREHQEAVNEWDVALRAALVSAGSRCQQAKESCDESGIVLVREAPPGNPYRDLLVCEAHAAVMVSSGLYFRVHGPAGSQEENE